MNAVRFQQVSRHFGQVRAVDRVDLEIAPGEFFAMLGPSGSGKTTCLRLIAGFEQPTGGHIEIFGETAEGVPPYRRNVNTVFQDYALFPHLNILDNVAYGLMVKGIGKNERVRAAEQALELVKLPGYGARRPGQLSGGQRQRVALARALVNKPKVLLLDEPLGALDLKLREQMQEELKSLQRALGITFVFVTHDQGEALSMADRVAVFNDGRIVQQGTPHDIYQRPKTRFVADFVGSSNVIAPETMSSLGGERRWASLRPEAIRLTEESGVAATVKATSFLGAATRLSVEANGTRLHVTVPAGQLAPDTGASVRLAWLPTDVHYMDDAA
ncbi:ABC transporter ATP-binding protein [Rhizobium sp. CNPSo 4062]|uniref:ABC transporter ATP-binding protein n=1 Tax=Rhizobium sp. CNPSo 4062 TaxID=3021410 RepID=UPI00254ABD15|nr:ABC transporter ATP-binding protein [Rhizobium sp. CNPSo 4062]MDK4705234.1 ABC transporter ATP-binding protein [Rhizobium sp. CNPSo 4062]